MNTQSIVGVPSFGSKLKQTRASGYTAINAMLDINDNVLGKATHIKNTFRINHITKNCESILISDDYLDGFTDINKTGSGNPFNFGHMRTGHSNDTETSEFGTGLKSAAVVLANVFTVYTKVGNAYKKVQFNFEEMAQDADPTHSYEPCIYTDITEDEYVANHTAVSGFSTGSTIVLTKLTQIGEELVVKDIENELRLANCRAIIANHISIQIQIDNANPYELKPITDIFTNAKCNERAITHHIHVAVEPITNNIVDIVIERSQTNKNATYFEWNKNDKKVLVPFGKKLQFNDRLDKIQKRYTVCLLTMKSTSTYDTDYRDDNGDIFLFYNKVRIVRGERRYDDATFIKQDNDGYCNHIYSELTYTSKLINPHIGMLFNKKINVHINTGLTQVIGYIQKVVKGKCYLHKERFEQVIIPRQPVLVIRAPVPPVQVPVPPVQVPIPPVEVPIPPVQVPIPPVQVPIPPVEVPIPPVEVPVPPVQVPVPPVQVPVPPVQVPIPPVEVPVPPSLDEYLIKMLTPIIQSSSKSSTSILDFHLQCTTVIEELYHLYVK
jgi:hypothetical protein